LYIFCGEFLLFARLRSPNIAAAAGSVEELQRIVAQIRSVWSQVRLVVRGDSEFCREEPMAWCEANCAEYLLGLAKNERLQAQIAQEMGEAKAQYQQTGRATRLFKEFVYQTRKSWRRARRVVAKAEHLEKGENPRFVVTSLSREANDGKKTPGLDQEIWDTPEKKIQAVHAFQRRESTSASPTCVHIEIG
jgi:hypothetical protein